MLLPRIVSAIILGPLFLGVVYLGFPWFHLVMAAMVAIMADEFSRMEGASDRKRRILIVVAVVAAVAAQSLGSWMAALAIVAAGSLAVIVADRIAGQRKPALVHVAVAYVALPAIAMLYVRDRGGFESLVWLLAVVWGTDIGAYACGRLIGGPKLAPSISPKKTWSGAIGGLVVGVGAAAAVMDFFDAPIGPLVLLAALVAAVATEAGDLLESALKRWYDVKDSGTLIPGHGGLLDRFDGLWAAAPVAALFLWMFGGGVHQW